ncbi:multiple monosaccharide ABC transporter permease [Naumannella halotolerans]|uniref:Xylose transport system permease protein XylH n=1 Tax=Naumannella halotolerans TaxID=993414 RepID=A0A4R7J945_9ACTN|nr:multiple monosaccharide ABC transporter permease [Naumannella halotolerans]TDT33845.1 putative multiple sugar transport system permease protein [Naumannella halotolerans]
MRHVKDIFGGDLRQFGMLIALIILIVFFHFMTGGKVIDPLNMMNIINGNAYILILAVGMVLVIIAGNIDLSVGSVAAFAGIVVAIAMRDYGVPWWGGILLCLLVGALVGAWQGFWVAYVGIPAFIVTLAGMLIFRGANQFVGNSTSVPVPAQIQYLGGGYLPEVGPNTGYNNLTLVLGLLVIVALVAGELLQRRSHNRTQAPNPPLWVSAVKLVLLAAIIWGATYLFATGRPGTSFPVPGLILVAMVLLYWFISSRTVFGRHVYAFGGNRQAAALSGVNTKFVNFLVMMNMSVLAALAGLIFIGRSTASGPADGNMWELDAIAAVFIGGAAVSGGVGTVIGALIGGLVMAVLNNGLQLLGVGADATQMIKGLVLLLAVAFDVWNKTQGKPSITGLLFGSKPASEHSTASVPVAEEATEPSKANA